MMDQPAAAKRQSRSQRSRHPLGSSLVPMEPMFDYDLAQLYARALIAIARADGQISGEEGQLLQRVIDARSAEPLQLDELMFDPAVTPEELATLVKADPFRGYTMHPIQ